jgi:hypothetical protein
MSDRNIGQEILDGIKEIKRFKKGEISLSTYTLSEPSGAKTIRKRLKLSQSAFCGLNGCKPTNNTGLGAGKKITSRSRKISFTNCRTAS